MTTTSIPAGQRVVCVADVHTIAGEKNADNYSPLLNSITRADSLASDDFKKKPDQTTCARNLYKDMALKTLPPELRDAQLSDKGEKIKELLGILKPNISNEKDNKSFDSIVQRLTKAQGDEKKESAVSGDLSKLLVDYGGKALNLFSLEYYAACVDAWKGHHPDIGQNINHDTVFNEQSLRCLSILKPEISDLIKKGNDWNALEQYASYFKDNNVALTKTLRHHPAELPPQENRVPNLGHPTGNVPGVGLGDGMKGGPNIVFAPVVHGAHASSTGGNTSSTGGNVYPGVISNGAMDWNAALDAVLTKGDLTEATRAKLSDDVIKAALQCAPQKENGGVLPNLHRVSAYTPDNNLSAQNNNPSLHNIPTGNRSTVPVPLSTDSGIPTPPPLPPTSVIPPQRPLPLAGTGTKVAPPSLNELKEKLHDELKAAIFARDELGQKPTVESIERDLARNRQENPIVKDKHLANIEEKGQKFGEREAKRAATASEILTPTTSMAPPPLLPPTSVIPMSSNSSLVEAGTITMPPDGAMDEPKTKFADHKEQTQGVTIEDLGEDLDEDLAVRRQGNPIAKDQHLANIREKGQQFGEREAKRAATASEILTPTTSMAPPPPPPLPPTSVIPMSSNSSLVKAGTIAMSPGGAMNEPKTKFADHKEQTQGVTVEDLGDDLAVNRQGNPIAQTPLGGHLANRPITDPAKAAITTQPLSGGEPVQLRTGETIMLTPSETGTEDVTDLASEAHRKPTLFSSHKAKAKPNMNKTQLQSKAEKLNSPNVLSGLSTTAQMPMSGSTQLRLDRNGPLRQSSSSSELSSSALATEKSSVITRNKHDAVYTTTRLPDFFSHRRSNPKHFNRVSTHSDSGRNFRWSFRTDKPQQNDTIKRTNDDSLDVNRETDKSLTGS